MNATWTSETTPAPYKISAMGYVRILWRGIPLLLVTTVCLVLMLLLRLIERPIYGLRRPFTPYLTLLVCKSAFFFIGMGYSTRGEIMPHKGAVVSNHASWLDIFALNARKRIYFVAKSEVANWPGIGWLARATGTVFIARKASDAQRQREIFQSRLLAGHKLLFFPEGTSTDGLRVLRFKSTLFAAFFAPEVVDEMWIQPVTVNYTAPEGESAEFYGWWGDMGFASHFLKTLAVKRQGSVEVVYHPAVEAKGFDSRKSLARHCESEVRKGLVVS
ncbi:lysophospholipid acyltransferase family protein [Falsihalocynthiibacter sp. SS001]|uniref:lysophospholipid acyltransferase family protein n=1 Tax=Falsihalocynthiibacter sp. SS001 TaxID=3349698 RepID=UPI0036D20E66